MGRTRVEQGASPDSSTKGPASERLELRLTPEEKLGWERAAIAARVTTSVYVRRAVNDALALERALLVERTRAEDARKRLEREAYPQDASA